MLYASTGDTRFADRIDRVLAALEECQKAGGDGYLLGTPDSRRVFREIEQGDLRLTDLFKYNGAAEPYYAMEKLLSGLRDAYRIARRQTSSQTYEHPVPEDCIPGTTAQDFRPSHSTHGLSGPISPCSIINPSNEP